MVLSICTKLEGFYDCVKTKVELKEYQFDVKKYLVGDDLEFFTQELNDDKVKHLNAIRFLSLNQMRNSNNKFLHYSCSRLTFCIEKSKLETELLKVLKSTSKYYIFIFLMKSILSVVYIARLSNETRKLSVKVTFIDSNYH